MNAKTYSEREMNNPQLSHVQSGGKGRRRTRFDYLETSLTLLQIAHMSMTLRSSMPGKLELLDIDKSKTLLGEMTRDSDATPTPGR